MHRRPPKPQVGRAAIGCIGEDTPQSPHPRLVNRQHLPAACLGRDVLPIGGYLGNVPDPTLATLRADISRGYVRVFVLPVSPPGPEPRVRWLESQCTRGAQP
jgi:hypothetical protein